MEMMSYKHSLCLKVKENLDAWALTLNRSCGSYTFLKHPVSQVVKQVGM